MKCWMRTSLFLLACTLPGVAAQAQETPESRDDEKSPRARVPHLLGWGVRAGGAPSPDQLIAGVNLDMGGIADRVRAEPTFELGVGEDHTTFTATAALHFLINNEDRFQPYIGGGIGLGVDYFDPPYRGSDTDLKLSLSLIGGTSWVLKNRKEFFLEGSLILGSLHDLKLIAGWRF